VKNSNSTSIIIPTLNFSTNVKNPSSVIDMLAKSQCEIIVIDSSSTDSTVELFNNVATRIVSVPRQEFNHGRTRNIAARLSKNANLVFMTQDVLPSTPSVLFKLSRNLGEGRVVATFARQLPRPEASLLERFSRYFNYPEQSQIRTQADIERLGVKAFFFSNVCSAVRADVFWEVGGFPEDVIMNEDMTLAAKLLRAGHTIKYVAEAEVIHSHDYTLAQQFRRNFDVGAFFADAGPELDGAKVGGEGLRFVCEQLRYVLRHSRPDLIARVIAESAAKFTAFQLGRHHRWLPLSLKKRLSMHNYHWDQRKERA
jgi:rhamnosyltransferase